ncbi:hypothetical protein D3C84_488880 [compost metagenome]
MQAPVAGAGDDRLPRELGPVQEKQQGYSDVGQPAEADGDLTAGRQQTGENDHTYQRQGEVIG